MDTIIYRPIGIIHTPFKEPEGTPVQPSAAVGSTGTIEVFPDYADGLKDIDGFSRLMLLYHFHRSGNAKLRVIPFMDTREHGIFAVRAPSRPNPIGISVVRLIHVRDTVLTVEDIDILDGTPLLDIKPYVPQFDSFETAHIGWLEHTINSLPRARDDGRFSE